MEGRPKEMSKRTYLGEQLEVEKVVIDSDIECEYKIDGTCNNNYNMKWLGKKCHFLCERECKYYKKESGKVEWSVKKRLKNCEKG